MVIVGPTASGKSDLAVKLAKKFDGEIISADSRQVYKGLNIGSGKITKKEMRGIPHYLLDVANPKKQFSIAQYVTLATDSLQDIINRKKLPIICGGTGFYIDALVGKISIPDVKPNPQLRKKLGKKTALELFKILEKKDPQRAKTIDRYNKVRLIRALEIIEKLGKVPNPPRCQPARLTPWGSTRGKDYEFVYIGLLPDDLEKKILIRLDKRMPDIIREVRKLHKNGLSYKHLVELGLEYRYTSLYLQGKLSREQMIEKLYTEIKRYAKRQMTWFKRNKEIKWILP